MSRDDRLRLAWLGLHPDRMAALSQQGGATHAMRAIERHRVRVSDPVRERIVTSSEARRYLDRLGLRPVFADDAEYPADLAALPGSPDLLFVSGRLPDIAGVAIVGTRRCTSYGRGVAREMGKAVAAAGWPVVSGLARGVDGAAHEGTVSAGGIGVAVLGCGGDIVYPPEHRPLRDSLLASGGAVVSEYPPGTPPEGWRFPPRNRIISGMSRAVVIVEAPAGGGAQVTASAALDQGRHVLAVPGDIDRETSVGCNMLIRDGAVPVLGPDDLIEALTILLNQAPPAEAVKQGS